MTSDALGTLWVVFLFVSLGSLVVLRPLWDAIGLGSGVESPIVFWLSALLLWPFYRDRVATTFWRFAVWTAMGMVVASVAVAALARFPA